MLNVPAFFNSGGRHHQGEKRWFCSVYLPTTIPTRFDSDVSVVSIEVCIVRIKAKMFSVWTNKKLCIAVGPNTWVKNSILFEKKKSFSIQLWGFRTVLGLVLHLALLRDLTSCIKTVGQNFKSFIVPCRLADLRIIPGHCWLYSWLA